MHRSSIQIIENDAVLITNIQFYTIQTRNKNESTENYIVFSLYIKVFLLFWIIHDIHQIHYPERYNTKKANTTFCQKPYTNKKEITISLLKHKKDRSKAAIKVETKWNEMLCVSLLALPFQIFIQVPFFAFKIKTKNKIKTEILMREVWTEDRKQKWDFWRENLVLVSRLTNSIEKQMNQIGFVTRFFWWKCLIKWKLWWISKQNQWQFWIDKN